jgi:hypothetical protein
VGARLKFDEATHTYRVDDRIVDSVTQVLGRVYADVYANVPESVLLRKSQLGVAVHKAIEFAIHDMLDWSSLHPEVEPYVCCWYEWWSEQQLEAVKSEQQFYCESGDYCGTIDLETADSITDWKITGTKLPTHGLQVTGYAHAKGLRKARCLYLKDDGSPAELVEYDVAKLLPDWLATLRVSHLMRRFA